jgi:hypothetical protein
MILVVIRDFQFILIISIATHYATGVLSHHFESPLAINKLQSSLVILAQAKARIVSVIDSYSVEQPTARTT